MNKDNQEIMCKHKHQYAAVNKGIIVDCCILKKEIVNSVICQECTDRNGNSEQLAFDFLRRELLEIESIQQCCNGCSKFVIKTQTCSLSPEIIPIDILAQNPSNHCPKGLW